MQNKIGHCSDIFFSSIWTVFVHKVNHDSRSLFFFSFFFLTKKNIFKLSNIIHTYRWIHYAKPSSINLLHEIRRSSTKIELKRQNLCGTDFQAYCSLFKTTTIKLSFTFLTFPKKKVSRSTFTLQYLDIL